MCSVNTRTTLKIILKNSKTSLSLVSNTIMLSFLFISFSTNCRFVKCKQDFIEERDKHKVKKLPLEMWLLRWDRSKQNRVIECPILDKSMLHSYMCTFPMCVFALFLAFCAIFQHIRGVSQRLFYNEVANYRSVLQLPVKPMEGSVFAWEKVSLILVSSLLKRTYWLKTLYKSQKSK